MDEWWHKDMQCFQTANYYKQDFATMTEKSSILFRKGAEDLLNLCKSSKIAVVIVSGGLSELIEHSLRLLEK